MPIAVCGDTYTNVRLSLLYNTVNQPAGQAVPKSQIIEGVSFIYQPPPRSKVPHAASIITDADSSSSKSPLSWSSGHKPGRGGKENHCQAPGGCCYNAMYTLLDNNA